MWLHCDRGFQGLSQVFSRRLLRGLVVYLCVGLLVAQTPARAIGFGPFNGKIGQMIGSVIQSKAVSRGISSGDSRIGVTASLIGSALTSVASGVPEAILSALGWPVVLAVGGIAAIASCASMDQDGSVTWCWQGDASSSSPGTATASGTGMPTGDPTQFPFMPSDLNTLFSTYGYPADLWFRTSATNTAPRHVNTLQVICPSAGAPYCNGISWASPACTYTSRPAQGTCVAYSGPYPGTNGYWAYIATQSTACQQTTNGSCVSMAYRVDYEFQWPSGATKTFPGYSSPNETPSQVMADIPTAVGTKPLSDAEIAAIVNSAWVKAGAIDDSGGLSYGTYGPVTQTDVAQWRVANQQLVPTVADLNTPVAGPGGTTVPVTVPSQSSGSGTGTGAGTTPGTTEIDWGSYPSVEAPSLEDTPTAQMITDPIFGLMPTLSNFSMPEHTSTCPTVAWDLSGFHSGWSWTVSGHCTLADDHRSEISVAMVLAWTLVAVFIVLGA